MPELPEVEFLRRSLDPHIKGRVIQSVDLRLAKQVRNLGAAEFCRRLTGQRILSTSRRGKYLLIHLKGEVLVVHLGMSGQVSFWDHKKKGSGGFSVHPVTGLQRAVGQHEPDKHTHALFLLDHGDRIQYRDIRQFGRLLLLKPTAVDSFPTFARLGLEPLGRGFSYAAFRRAMQEKKGMAKALLLSQSTVAGLGNIYADEALFRARIHPKRRMETLSEDRWKALHKAIPEVLRQGLKNRGTTLMDYRSAEGAMGSNQERLLAYGRAGLPCKRCKTVLVKIQVSQRSSVFCPACQPLG